MVIRTNAQRKYDADFPNYQSTSEAQFAGHVTANLAAGNDRRTLIAVVTQVLPFIGYTRTLNAVRGINDGTST